MSENVSASERNQVLSQSDPNVYGKSYISSISGVDGQSHFLGEKARHDHIELIRSASIYRLDGFPQELPAHEARAISKKIEIESRKLNNKGSIHLNISSIRKTLNDLRQRLTKEAMDRYRNEWIDQMKKGQILDRGRSVPKTHDQTYVLTQLLSIIPECMRLARVFNGDQDMTFEQRLAAVQDMTALCNMDTTVLYRPNEVPLNGLCPVKGCKEVMSK